MLRLSFVSQKLAFRRVIRSINWDLMSYFQIQWNPVNTVTNGPKKLAVLTGDRNKVFFTRKCKAVLPGGQKPMAALRSNRISEVAVRQGFTVIHENV